MNTINAAAAASLLPLPPSTMAPPPRDVVVTPVPVVAATGHVDQVTWSPGLWWLLYRYEYLFEGLIPQYRQQPVVIREPSQDGEPVGPSLESAQPHWDDSRLLNAPPSAATMPPAPIPEPVVKPTEINQPCVGTFVDLVA